MRFNRKHDDLYFKYLDIAKHHNVKNPKLNSGSFGPDMDMAFKSDLNGISYNIGYFNKRLHPEANESSHYEKLKIKLSNKYDPFANDQRRYRYAGEFIRRTRTSDIEPAENQVTSGVSPRMESTYASCVANDATNFILEDF